MISLSLDDDLVSLVLVKEAPLWSLDWPQPGDEDEEEGQDDLEDDDDHDKDANDDDNDLYLRSMRRWWSRRAGWRNC